ncbi:hypothetical protein [Bacillus mycoides]|uniref:hypothetical protein n=1 Tax=Bacillus mycoides TaxID=1405 RepID=UPI001C031A4F|nr:hypothetical protein [Bacillus mycoides]MCQ6532283.1 hypothetical protein [Bacillus mycoides]QWI54489.1 hypothetical protein EXW42_10120 [Bacillus mycoides]QWI91106.1 hypothetical protein J5W00_06350 [Bacillus mycoides]
MSINNEDKSDEQAIEDYVKEHSDNIQNLLADLNILVQKHKETLNEEQFFAVWNESPLSKQISKDGLTLYHALVLIAEEGLGIKVIKGAWD